MSDGETGSATSIADELLGIFARDRFHGLPEMFESLETLKQQTPRRRRHQRWQQNGRSQKVRDGGDR